MRSERGHLHDGGVWGLGFEVWGSGFGVRGLGFGVWGLGFWVLGLGFWVLGFGFGVLGLEDRSPSVDCKRIPFNRIATQTNTTFSLRPQNNMLMSPAITPPHAREIPGDITVKNAHKNHTDTRTRGHTLQYTHINKCTHIHTQNKNTNQMKLGLKQRRL